MFLSLLSTFEVTSGEAIEMGEGERKKDDLDMSGVDMERGEGEQLKELLLLNLHNYTVICCELECCPFCIVGSVFQEFSAIFGK